MSTEAKEAKRKYMREYMRKWRAVPENREREKVHRANFWERQAKKMKKENEHNENK